jgi:DNA-binding MarR family transcriptional regulator
VPGPDLAGRPDQSEQALARRAGLHPATMTGILDRLERCGWIVRKRDPDATDRRAVAGRALRDRGGELLTLYAGIIGSMDKLCAGNSEAELELLADFLRRTTEPGRAATEELADERRGRVSICPRPHVERESAAARRRAVVIL